MNRVVWTEFALANVRAIRAYLAQFNPRAAGELATRLIAAGNSIAMFPHRGRPLRRADTRELLSVSLYIFAAASCAMRS